MATGLTWRQKLEALDEFLPLIVHQIRVQLEQVYFLEHSDFVLAYFPRYYKQHRLLRLSDLVEGILQATLRNSSLDESEKYSQEFSTMWILDNVAIYEMFEEELKSVHEDFEELTELDAATSARLAAESSERFGSVSTYLFVVLMSVLLDPCTMESIREAAYAAIKEISLDMTSTISTEEPNDRTRLAKSDGMELIRPPSDPVRRSPMVSPKKGIDNDSANAANLIIGSYPPHSDPSLHAKAKPRLYMEHNLKAEVINRRHSSQLNFSASRSPYQGPGARNRYISSPIKMSQSSSSSISLADGSSDEDLSESGLETDDSYVGNMIRSSSELTTKTAPESGRSMMSAVRSRLRSSREAGTSADQNSTSKPNDIYQKYLKQHRLEGWLSKQTRNPSRPDAKYIDKPWKKRWVTLGDSSISYLDSPGAADPTGCIPLHIISRVGTASSIGSNTVFYVEAANRMFLFRASSESEMKEWLFTVQCAIAVNLESIVDPKSRRRGEILSNIKKWWKRASTDWSDLLLDLEKDELETDETVVAVTPNDATLPSPLISRPDLFSAPDVRAHAAPCARQGCRDYMEDEYRIMANLPLANEKIMFASVFDGHGGGEAAQFCRLNFAELLTDQLAISSSQGALSPETLSTDLSTTFLRVDKEFIRGCHAEQSSGTTATALLVTSTHFICANVGDSRAILCQSNGSTKVLTVDHRPSVQEERDRILKSGAKIEDTNEIDMGKLFKLNPSLLQAVQIPQRLAQMVGFVTTSRVEGCLCVSRAIGDAEFKGGRRVRIFGPSPDPENPDIIISQPAVSVTARDPTQDQFIVIASDGVWDFLDTDYVAEFVREELRKSVQPLIIAENLVTKALTQGSQDNITVIIIFLNLPQGGSLKRSRPAAASGSGPSLLSRP